MAHLEPAPSSDVLFPEEGHLRGNYSEDCYAPGSNSTYSSYSHEVKYIFEPEYSQPNHEYEAPKYQHTQPDIHEDHDEGHHEEEKDQLYSPPYSQNDPRRYYRSQHGYLSNHQNPQYYPNNHPNNHLVHDSHSSPGKYLTIASRRHTWSPPTFNKAMGVGGSFPMRSYRSNDQLDIDVDNGNYYEDLDSGGPPRLAPVSGMLNKNAPNSLIRPIAFKPVVRQHSRYVSMPQGSKPPHPPRQTPFCPSRDMRLANHSQDDGYVSQECNSGSHSHSTSNLSQASLHVDCNRPVGYHHIGPKVPDRPSSFNSSNLSRASSNRTEGYIQTPSPSDSGVGEMEAMLRDKDAEIQHLRETMEHNESVIIQVYKEKEENWEMEMKELNEEWGRRLRYQQQKSFKMEQALLLQLFKLQQERKNLRLDVDQVRAEKEQMEQKYEDLEDDYNNAKAKLEEVQWTMCQKSGEISLLKSHLKEAKDESANRTNDLLGLKAHLKDTNTEREEKDREITRLQSELSKAQQECQSLCSELEQFRKDTDKSFCEKALQTEECCDTPNSDSAEASSQMEGVTKLSTELELVRKDLEKSRADFEHERDQWFDEKNKVIRYQKHLQLNYVQMYRKNQRLEAEVEQLMMELENRDIHIQVTKVSPSESEEPGDEEVLESAC